MEPMNGTALFQEGKLDIWAANQAPVLIRDACADALDISKDDVNLHTHFIAGDLADVLTLILSFLQPNLPKKCPEFHYKSLGAEKKICAMISIAPERFVITARNLKMEKSQHLTEKCPLLLHLHQ